VFDVRRGPHDTDASAPVVVTGATGRVGRVYSTSLIDAGVPVRALLRIKPVRNWGTLGDNGRSSPGTET
jgi:nucleoside-diphosphate-sugar epimerase